LFIIFLPAYYNCSNKCYT